MSIRGRIKIIERIAQTAQPGAPTVSGSPSRVDITTFFPAVPKVWGINNLSKIQLIINAINNAIYVLSAAQIDFNTLRTQYFNVDTSKFPDPVLTAIIRLAQVIYSRMLTNYTKERIQAIPIEEKQQIIKQIQHSLNVSAIPDGGINNYLATKTGNFKETLNGILSTIR